MGRRVKAGSLWGLGIAILAMLAILAIATRLSPGPGLLVLGLGVALLGYAAWRWGYDSRGGRNW
jgi:hypothetical protein